MKQTIQFITICSFLLLAGCLDYVFKRDCQYRPLYGVAVLTPMSDSQVNVAFRAASDEDRTLFKKYQIDASQLSMPRKAAPDGGRYRAIVNIRTTGQCSPYIIFLSEPAPEQTAVY